MPDFWEWATGGSAEGSTPEGGAAPNFWDWAASEPEEEVLRKREQLAAQQTGGAAQWDQISADWNRGPWGGGPVTEAVEQTARDLSAGIETGIQGLKVGAGRALEDLGESAASGLLARTPGLGPIFQGLAPVAAGLGETLSADVANQDVIQAENERRFAEAGPVQRFGMEAAAQIPQLAAMAAAPELAIPMIGVTSYGQAAEQAESQGATEEQQQRVGLETAAVEMVTERWATLPVIRRVVKGYQTMPQNAVPGSLKRLVVKDLAKNFGEEAAASVGDRIAELESYKAERGEKLTWSDAAQALHDGALGLVTIAPLSVAGSQFARQDAIEAERSRFEQEAAARAEAEAAAATEADMAARTKRAQDTTLLLHQARQADPRMSQKLMTEATMSGVRRAREEAGIPPPGAPGIGAPPPLYGPEGDVANVPAEEPAPRGALPEELDEARARVSGAVGRMVEKRAVTGKATDIEGWIAKVREETENAPTTERNVPNAQEDARQAGNAPNAPQRVAPSPAQRAEANAPARGVGEAPPGPEAESRPTPEAPAVLTKPRPEGAPAEPVLDLAVKDVPPDWTPQQRIGWAKAKLAEINAEWESQKATRLTNQGLGLRSDARHNKLLRLNHNRRMQSLREEIALAKANKPPRNPWTPRPPKEENEETPAQAVARFQREEIARAEAARAAPAPAAAPKPSAPTPATEEGEIIEVNAPLRSLPEGLAPKERIAAIDAKLEEAGKRRAEVLATPRWSKSKKSQYPGERRSSYGDWRRQELAGIRDDEAWLKERRREAVHEEYSKRRAAEGKPAPAPLAPKKERPRFKPETKEVGARGAEAHYKAEEEAHDAARAKLDAAAAHVAKVRRDKMTPKESELTAVDDALREYYGDRYGEVRGSFNRMVERVGQLPEKEADRVMGRIEEQVDSSDMNHDEWAYLANEDPYIAIGEKEQPDELRERLGQYGEEEGEAPKGMASLPKGAPATMTVAASAPRDKAKEIGAPEVLRQMQQRWKVPIRFRRYRESLRAIFKPQSEVIRLDRAGDLPAAIHEVGHFLWKKSPALHPGGSTVARDELYRLGRALYGPNKQAPVSWFVEEGFAEYLRHRISMDDADTAAPEFHKLFEAAIANDFELAAKLAGTRELFDRYRQQDPMARAIGQVDWEGTLGKPTGAQRLAFWRKGFIHGLIDRWSAVKDPAAWAIKQKGLTWEDVPAAQNPARILAAFEGTSAARARKAVLSGVRGLDGALLGPSLREALKKALPPEATQDDYREFFAYALAKHTVELAGRKKPISTGISLDDAKAILRDHANPDWDAGVEALNHFGNSLVDYAQQSGLLTESAAKAIKESSSFYLPLTRVYLESAGGLLASAYEGKRRQGVGSGQPFARLKGNERPVQDPVLSFVQLAERVFSMSDKARAGRALWGLVRDVPGHGEFMEEIDAPLKATEASLRSIKSQLKKLGIDLPPGTDQDAILTLFSNEAFADESDPVVSLVIDGKRRFFHIQDPHLFRALANVPPVFAKIMSNPVTKLFRSMASGVRLGATGLNPGFGIITNPTRDFLTGSMQTTIPWMQFARGFFTPGSDAELNELFFAGGGELSSPIGQDMRRLKQIRRELLAMTPKQRAELHATHPVESLRELIAFSETFGRRSEFKAVYNREIAKGRSKEDAWVAAQESAAEVTVNFRRAGVYAQAANQLIPFFNVAIQGPRAFAKALSSSNPRTRAAAWVKAGIGLTLPALMLYSLHKDEEWWQETPTWEKALFIHFRLGNHTIRVPLPFEWGLMFATIPVAALDLQRTKDTDRFLDTMGEALKALAPSVAPPALQAWVEWIGNVNFLTGRALESENLKRRLAVERFYRSTSEVYKGIARLLDTNAVSRPLAHPVKIENTLQRMTGGLIRTVTDPFKTSKGRESADIPVVGRVFSRQKREGQSVSDFYERLKSAEEAYTTILGIHGNKEIDRAVRDRRIAELEGRYAGVLGTQPKIPLVKGETRNRYPTLYRLRDYDKWIRYAKIADDPKLATKLARIALGRAVEKSLTREERRILAEAKAESK